jgi:hypothetical protein
MALRSLSDNYDRICQLLETAVDKREGLFKYKDRLYTFDLRRDWKALRDYNRDITYAITMLIRTDRQFRGACGDRVFSSNQIMKLVLAEKLIPPETVRYLAHIEDQLITELRDDASDIKKLRQLLKQQSNAQTDANIARLEENIRSVTQRLFKKAGPYQELQTFAHKQVPGTLREQEIMNATRFAPQDANGASLWELVKFAAEIEIFLNTVMGLVTHPNATRARGPTVEVSSTGEALQCQNVPDAVRFACTPGCTLQSAADAVLALCHEPTKERLGVQLTRTLAIHFVVNRQCYIAFDDAPEENILLRGAATAYDPEHPHTPWFVSMKPAEHPLLARALERARRHNRVISMPAMAWTRFTPDEIANGALRAIIGPEASAAYAQWIRQETANKWNRVGELKVGAQWERLASNPWLAELYVVTVGENTIGCAYLGQWGRAVRVPIPRA